MSLPAGRVHEIDGIRGWAALCVLFFHLLWEVFGQVHPEIRMSLGRLLLDGPLAVYIFFILSGDALSLCFTSGPRVSPRLVLKRYPRLAGPLMFSFLTVYVVMALRLNFNNEAAVIVSRPDWLGVFLQFDPSISTAVKQGLLTVFIDLPVATSYNPFLWPMGIELAGSGIVLCIGCVFHAVRWPRALLLLGAVYLTALSSVYALFIIGILFGSLRSLPLSKQLRSNKVASVACMGLLAATLIVNARLGPTSKSLRTEILIATMIVGVCYSSSHIVQFMGNRLSQGLGRISFPMYFMHFAVIVSLTSWLITVLAPRYGTGWDLVVIVTLASVVTVVAIAVATEAVESSYLKFVDRAILAMLKKPDPGEIMHTSRTSIHEAQPAMQH